MAIVNMPSLQSGQTDAQRIAALEDYTFALKRQLEWIMLNLDSKNIKEIDANITKLKNVEAETIVTETILTETLYAERGYIAELTVDQLETGNKVANYKNSDTSDINYLKIYEQYIQFITASVTSPVGTEQATDRHGQLLYWRTSAEEATTTNVTSFPVMIYTYNEFVKQQIAFFFDGVEQVPKIQLGTGSDPSGVTDNGKGFIWKDTNGLTLQYITTDGTERQIEITNDGIVLSNGSDTVTIGDDEFAIKGNTSTKLFVQADEPTDGQTNDIWIDTDDTTIRGSQLQLDEETTEPVSEINKAFMWVDNNQNIFVKFSDGTVKQVDLTTIP